MPRTTPRHVHRYIRDLRHRLRRPSRSRISALTMTSKPPATVNTSTHAKEGTISGHELNQLLHSSTLLSFLLVDCRSSNCFRENRIHYSVNVPIDDDANTQERFTTKSDIVKFLQAHCPALLGFLNGPGFYTDIVLYDHTSSYGNISSSVKLLLNAIRKWNEHTKTKVDLLDGGIEAFGKKYPYRVATECMFPVAWSFPATVSQLQDCWCTHCSRTLGRQQKFRVCSSEATGYSLQSHLTNLNYASNKTWFLVVCKRQVKSLESVKLALIQDELAELAKVQERLLIPDDVRCPVCFEIYNGDIIQCINGHCICGDCSDNISLCPECRTPYECGTGERIRNRSMERMLSTIFKIDCPFSRNGCKEKVTYNQVVAHMMICQKKEKSTEVLLIEEDVDLIENEFATMKGRLVALSKDIIETEMNWNTTGHDQIPGVTQELLERVYYNNDLLNKAKLALSQETFFKNGPVTVKSNMFQ